MSVKREDSGDVFKGFILFLMVFYSSKNVFLHRRTQKSAVLKMTCRFNQHKRKGMKSVGFVNSFPP